MSSHDSRLALADDEVLDKYAARAAEMKGVELEQLKAPFLLGVRTVYRVVAFDVDGTLTAPQQTTLDGETVPLVAALLGRAVPVTLVTGRGRGAARDAVEELRQLSGLRMDQMLRLSVVTHNGLRLLETPPGGELLARDIQLCDPLDVEAIETQVGELLTVSGLALPPISREPGALRLEFGDEQTMTASLTELQPLASDAVFVSGGRYASRWMIDVSPTTKALALKAVAKRRGVSAARILRIGDQGHEAGNDHQMLDSRAGWSVGELSKKPGGCWPVLDESFAQLTGVGATKRLLENLLVLAPLTTLPDDEQDVLSGLLQFERRAQRRANREAITARSRLRLRLGALLAEQEDARVDHATLQIADIYDTRSGAVRFRDWELEDDALRLALETQFGAHLHGSRCDSAPQMPWCMYTDTALILRGPNYYWRETHKLGEQTLAPFLGAQIEFLQTAETSLQTLSAAPFSFGRFKLVAGILDNIRNTLLHLQVGAYGARGACPEELIRVHGLLFEHLETHMRFLSTTDTPWRTSVEESGEHVAAVIATVGALREVSALAEQQVSDMRECDCLIENVMAVDIGLRKLRRQFAPDDGQRLTSVGLLRGGVELPVLAEVFAGRRSWRIDPALLSISTYSGEDARARVRDGDIAYVAALRNEGRDQLAALTSADIAGTPVVLMDDNCTTATTLQNARDLLVLLGYDVVGAIVVRYPGVNRRVHMALTNHGFPDPEALFGFIRGLVAPSPYTRLLLPGDTTDTVYRDQRGVFNKSKGRIERYLHKNGTPALDSDGEAIVE